MTEFSEQEFKTSARAIGSALILACERKHIPTDDISQVVGAAMAEVLAAYLGPLGAVERLRDLADLIERQCFDEAAEY